MIPITEIANLIKKIFNNQTELLNKTQKFDEEFHQAVQNDDQEFLISWLLTHSYFLETCFDKLLNSKTEEDPVDIIFKIIIDHLNMKQKQQKKYLLIEKIKSNHDPLSDQLLQLMDEIHSCDQLEIVLQARILSSILKKEMRQILFSLPTNSEKIHFTENLLTIFLLLTEAYGYNLSSEILKDLDSFIKEKYFEAILEEKDNVRMIDLFENYSDLPLPKLSEDIVDHADNLKIDIPFEKLPLLHFEKNKLPLEITHLLELEKNKLYNPLIEEGHSFDISFSKEAIQKKLEKFEDPILKLKFLEDYFQKLSCSKSRDPKIDTFLFFRNLTYSYTQLTNIKNLKEVFYEIFKNTLPLYQGQGDHRKIEFLCEQVSCSRLIHFNRTQFSAFVKRDTRTKNDIKNLLSHVEITAGRGKICYLI